VSAELPPAVIFDFDGTIADSLAAVLAAYNGCAVRRHLPVIDLVRYQALRDLGPQAVLSELGVPIWRVPGIMRDVRAALRGQMSELAPFAGMRELLSALREAGCSLYIVSSNARDNIDAFCARHALPPFDGFRCGVGLLGKAAHLRRLMTRERLDRSRSFYVGDEVRDVAAAAEVGMRSIAVTWGYGGRVGLAARRPDHLVDTPAEILASVRGLPATW
jgi:phosphoglycolate phosphatase